MPYSLNPQSAICTSRIRNFLGFLAGIPRPRKNIFTSKFYLFTAFGILALAAAIFSLVMLRPLNPNRSQTISATVTDNRVDVEQPKMTVSINKDFAFPLKDETGKEIGKFAYTIEGGELRDEIIVKGQKATAVKGREFLILNLKLKNDGNKAITINSGDFVRLSVQNNPDWLAPDIHNDPVTVQSISTKYTRLGFPVNDTDLDFKLQVGETKGSKTIVDLNFH